MNNLKKWFKKKIAILALAMANVEKNAFSQKGEQLESDTNKISDKDSNTLLHSLKNSVVTQEVENLRWRLYKVLEASDTLTSIIVGYDDDGYPIVETKDVSTKQQKILLNKVILDEYDNYELELVVDNSPITISTGDAMINEISSENHSSDLKPERPVKVIREFIPKFEIEKYTKKINIRDIDGKNKLIEFYISKYPNFYDKRSTLLLSEIKKIVNNPRSSNIVDIDGIGFITYKTLGVKDFMEYHYKVNGFDKVIEFDGNYVIKFKCEVILNGEYLLEKYRMKDLDTKYKNKERKK